MDIGFRARGAARPAAARSSHAAVAKRSDGDDRERGEGGEGDEEQRASHGAGFGRDRVEEQRQEHDGRDDDGGDGKRGSVHGEAAEPARSGAAGNHPR